MTSPIHSQYMQRCIQLAAGGLGKVAPNPLVGCVIVHDDKVIGEGYHEQYGGPHAEVNAIAQVKYPSLLAQSTLYVNLEPCSHFGKTPPCADLIISSGIKKVVIACKDPFPFVAGKGIEKLESAGIDVTLGVLEKDASFLNRRFLTFHNEHRPWIILKWAQTKDGFIDILRKETSPAQPTWITDEHLKTLVHCWRTEEAAIMVGTTTAEMDNPQLTAREYPGRNPLRIVIDRDLSLPMCLHLFDGSTPTLVLTEYSEPARPNIEFIKMEFGQNFLRDLSGLLFERNIQSLIVEGGRELLNTFIRAGFWDEARVLTGDCTFVQGLAAPEFPFSPAKEIVFGQDILSLYYKG